MQADITSWENQGTQGVILKFIGSFFLPLKKIEQKGEQNERKIINNFYG